MAVGDLLAHVYGPYPDDVVMNSAFPPKSLGMKIPVRQLELYCNDEPIGFDQSEYIISPPQNSPLHRGLDVSFFGVIEVLNLDWLSDKGREYLLSDFVEKDGEIHTISALPRNFTLQQVYGQWKRKLKIRIHCIKNLLANYLTSDSDPERLLIYSNTQGMKRIYWVQSLMPLTFSQSRNFLERYQLRALIVELIQTDPDSTPLEDRNIEWILDRYFLEIWPRDLENFKRLISVGDIDLQMEEIVKTEPRFLRHIPRAEVRGYFAAHAEWLLANQVASSNAGSNTRLVDVAQWVAFCKEARNDSIHAQQNGVRWGLAHGCEIDKKSKYDLAKNLAKFGQNAEFWARQLKNASQRKIRAAAKRQRRQSTPDPIPASAPSRVAPAFQYDSDFSEPSSSEDSDFEMGEEPTINLQALEFCFHPPQIPTGHFTWYCNGPGCSYYINLLNISQQDLALLPQSTIRVLAGKSWRVHDEPLKKALDLLVSHHYEVVHLTPNNLRLVFTEGSRCRIEYVTPVRNLLPHKPIQVKQEEPSQTLQQSSRNSKRPRRFNT